MFPLQEQQHQRFGLFVELVKPVDQITFGCVCFVWLRATFKFSAQQSEER